MPAITLKFIGAISLGLVYQFYYGGGDTLNYFLHGSKHIWRAFMEQPAVGFTLLFSPGGEYIPEAFEYSSKIWYYGDVHSYFIVRIAAFFDLFTFNTYSATALFFAVWSFLGSWSLFRTFHKLYPEQTKWIAISILFIPSVVFWGSGILKDSVTFGALCWASSIFIRYVMSRKLKITQLIWFLFNVWLLASIKMYILLSFLAGVAVLVYSIQIIKIRSRFIRTILAPIVLIGVGFGTYYLMNVVAGDSAYSLSNVAKTAAVTAYDIRYGWGARNDPGSGYTLGNLDGSVTSMLVLLPAAINVSLFRPYLWEVTNPLMLLSAIESLIFLYLTIYFLYKGRRQLGKLFNDPILRFCLVFSLLFAFAVGVSTQNFGTLMRYKIPMMPFYGLFLVVLNHSRLSKLTR